jgi:NTP pyrophosphatase (non-canonical NTP hydrolase)
MTMELNEYQSRAVETAIFPGSGTMLGKMYCALGVAGEAGEVAEKIKKAYRDDEGNLTSDRRADLLKEIGGVLWYIANLAAQCGATLDDVASLNLAQLADRKARGVLRGSGDNR